MTHASRRQLGLMLGLALGAGYSITSNMINRWTLPDLEFFVPWPGTWGLIFTSTALFGLLGMIAAWTEESIPGIILAGVTGSLISSLWIAITESAYGSGAVVVLFIVFLPRVFFYLPIGWVLRWLVERLEFNPRRPMAPARRLVPALVAFTALTLLGLTSRYPEEVRLSMLRMDALIREGQQAASFDELPEPLKDVFGFRERARGTYTFEVGRDPDVLPVQRPFVEYGEIEPFLLIRFETGFRFGCVFSPPYVVPACIDF